MRRATLAAYAGRAGHDGRRAPARAPVAAMHEPDDSGSGDESAGGHGRSLHGGNDRARRARGRRGSGAPGVCVRASTPASTGRLSVLAIRRLALSGVPPAP